LLEPHIRGTSDLSMVILTLKVHKTSIDSRGSQASAYRMFRLLDYNIVRKTRREIELEAWLRQRAWYHPVTDTFILDVDLRVDEIKDGDDAGH
jgi:hypothetical protein